MIPGTEKWRFAVPRTGFAIFLFLAFLSPPAFGQTEKRTWQISGIGVDTAAGILPRFVQSPLMKASHDIHGLSAGARLRVSGPAADWVVRLGWTQLFFEDNNYLLRGLPWDYAKYAEFGPAGLLSLQISREKTYPIRSALSWYWNVGVQAGHLTGRMTLYDTQGCTADNWQRPDADPAWGGCYHNPADYDMDKRKLFPVMAAVHGGLGLVLDAGHSRWRMEAAFALPGLITLSLSVETNFPGH